MFRVGGDQRAVDVELDLPGAPDVLVFVEIAVSAGYRSRRALAFGDRREIRHLQRRRSLPLILKINFRFAVVDEVENIGDGT